MSRDKNSAGWIAKFGVALTFLAAAVFLVTLRNRPVPTIDGAVYASLARHIYESGSWYPMIYLNRIFADHPPFFVWSIAASYKVFGLNDFAANFPMHFFSFLVVILTGMIGKKAGLSKGVSLAAAITLCATRDFVLSSVRGYIEPLMEFWIYLGFFFVIKQFNKKNPIWSFFAAVCVLLAWFSKGPPALWPTVFFLFLLMWKKTTVRSKISRISVYTLTLMAGTGLVSLLIRKYDVNDTFHHYFTKQVLGSALEGRNGAQTYDPFYFFKILKNYYWPWLPLFIVGIWFSFQEFFFGSKSQKPIPGLDLPAEELFPKPLPSWIYLVMASGFIGGFSIVKWKFWYYIAPAYPAMALFIASTVYRKIAGVFERPSFFKAVTLGSLIWAGAVSIFPIRTWKDRVPEVTEFHYTIKNSSPFYQVFFLNDERDHNLIGTSGEWYFHREVVKLASPKETNTIPQNSWLIASQNNFNQCKESSDQCKKAVLIQSHKNSNLYFVPGN